MKCLSQRITYLKLMLKVIHCIPMTKAVLIFKKENDMARYIDVDLAIKLHEGELWAWDVCDLKEFLAEVPTADVVPKSEVERLYYNLQAVLEERAEPKKELAMEIFEEIERICVGMQDYTDYAELKKKYTEGEPNG